MTHLAPSVALFQKEVLQGLSKPQKEIPAKYFYDEAGSHLFNQICETEEYYPTDAEVEIMGSHGEEIAERIGSRVLLVELGSGSGLKTRILLNHLHDPAGYVPIDISKEHLRMWVERLRESYEYLEILPLCADFTHAFKVPTSQKEVARKVFYFPGSTIGNFDRPHALELLKRLAVDGRPQGGLLIGVDLKKDRQTLEAAYNDAQGVTASFNLNLLKRMNRELATNFAIPAFQHEARYNAKAGCVEMCLVSTQAQEVKLKGKSFRFKKGEHIMTERSFKYSPQEFQKLAKAAGFAIDIFWTDSRNYFSVYYLTAV